MSDTEKFVLFDGERWWYHLPVTTAEPPLADGEAMNQSPRRNWWWADHEAESIHLQRSDPKTPTMYRLRTGYAPSVEMPREITAEVYRTWTSGGWEDDDNDPRHAFYEVSQWNEPKSWLEPVEGPWLRLDGAPAEPPPAGATWEATLPYSLRHATEYLHLFPGRLVGFRKAVTEALNAIPNVNAYDHSEFKVYLKAELEVPVFAAGQGRKRRQEIRSRTVSIPFKRPPEFIAAPSLAAAAAEWSSRLAEMVEEVRNLAHAHICSRCDGTGVLIGPPNP